MGRKGERFWNIHPDPVPNVPVENGAATTEQSKLVLQFVAGLRVMPKLA